MYKRLMTMLALCLGALLISTACLISSMRGSGEVITVTRPVSNFDHVSLSGVGTLIIQQGEQESLEIEAEDNLLEHIRTEVHGQTLEIGIDNAGWRQSIQPTKPIRYYLTVIDLSGISISGAGNVETGEIDTDVLLVAASGAGNIEIDGLRANRFGLELSGAGNCTIRAGQVGVQTVDISGAGNYESGNLESQQATIRISGLGNATLWANESLDIEISGAGNVDYFGSPQVTQQISGLGKVEHQELP
ncbi:MAG: DUF2807 domain-containing protein [Anaerolineales bacterium]|nr:DUF2807 domain-containing protein [Anaerolineales bacterium]